MEELIVDAWEIHNRIGIFFLSGIEEPALQDSAAKRGRTVADHFSHIHNVRLMWLKSAAPDLLEGVTKIEKTDLIGKDALVSALTESGAAMAALFRKSLSEEGKVKGFKPNAIAFLGYPVSHESFHMGKIDMTLRLSDHSVDDKTHYGMWEWGVR